MSGLNYWVIDCETSGLSSKYHEMTEVSIIKCDTRVQLTEMIKCDYPSRANLDSLRITNKTMADLSLGKTKEAVVEKIDRFLNEDGLSPRHRCLIAHNASFDRRFIWALYEKVGKKLSADLWLDTMALTKAYAKQIGLVKPKVNLMAACDIVGIKKFAGAHASQVDTRNTYLLWKNLVEQKGIDYLPFIKTFPHQYQDPEAALAALDNEEFDPSLLDIE
jgi:DNA polymerase III epsilon subunit-like protein